MTSVTIPAAPAPHGAEHEDASTQSAKAPPPKETQYQESTPPQGSAPGALTLIGENSKQRESGNQHPNGIITGQFLGIVSQPPVIGNNQAPPPKIDTGIQSHLPSGQERESIKNLGTPGSSSILSEQRSHPGKSLDQSNVTPMSDADSLLEYWWVLVPVVVGGVLIGYHYYRRKKNNKSDQTNSKQPDSDNAQGYAA